MLAIRQLNSAVAAWSVRGWPPLIPAPVAVDLQSHLLWSLTELSNAADHDDAGAVDDLAATTQVALDCLLRRRTLNTTATSIAMGLWGELSRAVGTELWGPAALHANTLRRLVRLDTPRLPGVTPAYVPPHKRIRNGFLPSITADSSAHARPPHEQLLTYVAAALASGLGHLVDWEDPDRPPPQLLPALVGWIDGRPGGPCLGSYRSATADDQISELVLRPATCVAAANQLDQQQRWTVRDAGEALWAAWITDTTLTVRGTRIRRLYTIDASVQSTDVAEPAWVLPVDVYSPDQFGIGGRRRRSKGRRLRSVT